MIFCFSFSKGAYIFFCLNVELVSTFIVFQANPPNPRTFPFILLGNKIDVDGGNSRVVRIYSCSAIHVSLFLRC